MEEKEPTSYPMMWSFMERQQLEKEFFDFVQKTAEIHKRTFFDILRQMRSKVIK